MQGEMAAWFLSHHYFFSCEGSRAVAGTCSHARCADISTALAAYEQELEEPFSAFQDCLEVLIQSWCRPL